VFGLCERGGSTGTGAWLTRCGSGRSQVARPPVLGRPRRLWRSPGHPLPPVLAILRPAVDESQTLPLLILIPNHRCPSNPPQGDFPSHLWDSSTVWGIGFSSSPRAHSSSGVPKTSRESNDKIDSNSGFSDLAM
jgi:hypothetical protein